MFMSSIRPGLKPGEVVAEDPPPRWTRRIEEGAAKLVYRQRSSCQRSSGMSAAHEVTGGLVFERVVRKRNVVRIYECRRI